MRPERKPDHLEVLTPDQLGQALFEYLERHRGLKVSKRVVHQYNDFWSGSSDHAVTVSIFESDEL
jgi:hypothetical protein